MASTQNVTTQKRPRLSLQIKTACNPPSKGLRGQPVNPSDPTTFNTMSNIYVTTIERSSAVLQSEPLTAINTLSNFSLQSPVEKTGSKPCIMTPSIPTDPETPVTAQRLSQRMNNVYPSTVSATPPLSAGAVENSSKTFAFSPISTSLSVNCRSVDLSEDEYTPHQKKGHIPSLSPSDHMPYTHPRSLHSILRNSPLPPRTAKPPSLPRRQSFRLGEKSAKKVEYDSPLEQEITTFKYTKSHNDLLTEDSSPLSPPHVLAVNEPQAIVDMASAFTGNENQDGGQTSRPFEDMRRKMAELGAGAGSPPLAPTRPSSFYPRRKRLEKKRHWVWTIEQEENDEDAGGAIASLRTQMAKKTRTRQ